MMKLKNGLLPAALLLTLAAYAGDEVLNARLLSNWDGGGNYADVWKDGDIAYVAQFGNSFVDILDISTPTAPIHLRQYDLQPPNHASSAQDVKVANGLMFIGIEGAGSDGCHIADVRDPANPVGLTNIDLNNFNSIHNVFYYEGWLFLCDSNTPRIGIIDLRTFDPDNPPAGNITALTYDITGVGIHFVHDITVVDERLYACGWDSGLWIYDVSDLANQAPRFLGSVGGNSTHSVWPTDDRRHVVVGEERSGGGILVYRVEDNGLGGLDLTLTDQEVMPQSRANSVHNQFVIGNRVFNSWYGAGLRVYDIDPILGSLTLAASYDTSLTESTWGVYPERNSDLVLISDINTGLYTIEIDPVNPGLLGDLDRNGEVNLLDMVLLAGNWGSCPACLADLNGDNTVDQDDLNMILLSWP